MDGLGDMVDERGDVGVAGVLRELWELADVVASAAVVPSPPAHAVTEASRITAPVTTALVPDVVTPPWRSVHVH